MANKKKKLTPKTWIEIGKSIRKPMPPPTKADKKLTVYDRKKEKKLPVEE
jgi:hypothetical protein